MDAYAQGDGSRWTGTKFKVTASMCWMQEVGQRQREIARDEAGEKNRGPIMKGQEGNGESMKHFRWRDDKMRIPLKVNHSCCFIQNESGRTGEESGKLVRRLLGHWIKAWIKVVAVRVEKNGWRYLKSQLTKFSDLLVIDGRVRKD